MSWHSPLARSPVVTRHARNGCLIIRLTLRGHRTRPYMCWACGRAAVYGVMFIRESTLFRTINLAKTISLKLYNQGFTLSYTINSRLQRNTSYNDTYYGDNNYNILIGIEGSDTKERRHSRRLWAGASAFSCACTLTHADALAVSSQKALPLSEAGSTVQGAACRQYPKGPFPTDVPSPFFVSRLYRKLNFRIFGFCLFRK